MTSFDDGPGVDFPDSDGPEITLPSGDVTEGVVRVGDTVRRPHQVTSDAVADYLGHLERVGFCGAPRYLGRDRLGRDVLTFIDGEVAGDRVDSWAASDAVLAGVGRLVRNLHDASEGWQPSAPIPRINGRPAARLPDGEPRLISHRDVTPQNVVFRDGVAFALIDFDLLDWTTRAMDLANTAMHWIPLRDPVDREPVYESIDVAHRLRLLLDGYGNDVLTSELVLSAASLRFDGLFESMRWNAQHLGGGWARMWSNGVGDVSRRRAQWFALARPELERRLL